MEGRRWRGEKRRWRGEERIAWERREMITNRKVSKGRGEGEGVRGEGGDEGDN